MAFWERHFLRLELVVAVVIAGGFATWGHLCNGFEVAYTILGESKSQVYGVIATTAGSLLGFVVVAVSIVAGYSSTARMRVVRESEHYSTLWDVFMSAIKALGLATASGFVGLVLDQSGRSAPWILILTVFAVSFAVLRIWRSVWVLERVIHVVTRDSEFGG